MFICLWQFDSSEVTLCGWQDVEIKLPTYCHAFVWTARTSVVVYVQDPKSTFGEEKTDDMDTQITRNSSSIIKKSLELLLM